MFCRENVRVVLQWVPSHCRIPGNEYVDSVAKRAHGLLTITNISFSLSDLLISCRRAILENWLSDRSGALRLTHLGSVRENTPTPFISYLCERQLHSALLRLRIGHTSLRGHLHRLNLVDSPFCQYCGAIETIAHVLLECPRYYTSRILLSASLRGLRVPFTVPGLLGKDTQDPTVKRKLYRHVSVFLKRTGLLRRL